MAQPDTASQERADSSAALDPLLAGYHCLFPRVFDEMMDHDGHVREHWRPFLSMLMALGPDEVNRHFAAADRQLRDSGVFYRVYEDPEGAVRPWPLSHVPLLINQTEWQELQAGLIPAAVVAGNPEFLRPMVGVKPRGDAYLRFYGVDVGRSPDGR